MPEFDTSHVKNIVLLGHAGARQDNIGGVHALRSRPHQPPRLHAGAQYRCPITMNWNRNEPTPSSPPCSTPNGAAIRSTSLIPPGYDDFAGEVVSRLLRVADTGIMLLNAVMGVEVGTDIIWEYTEQFKTPMIFAVNKLDDDNADFDNTVQEAKNHFGSKVVVVQYPRQQGAGFHEIIDVLRMTMYKFHGCRRQTRKTAHPR